MALLYAESFEWLNTSQLIRAFPVAAGGCAVVGGGRFGSGLQAGANNDAIKRSLPSHPATVIVGFALKWDQGPTAGSDYSIIWFGEGANNMIDVRVVSGGTLRITRNGTTLASTTATYTTGVWYYFELKFTIHNSTGSVELRQAGTAVASASGIDTQEGSNAYVDVWGLNNGPLFTAQRIYDDIYLCDSSGSEANDFLGDCRVEWRKPTGNGNSSQLVGSDGNSTDNYLLVDETPANDDTDYVGSATAGDKDTYAMEDLVTTSGTVHGMVIKATARKDDAGARSLATVARHSGTEADGTTTALSTSYQTIMQPQTRPGGGSWSIADVNAVEIGSKVA
jgi:hypothetical protein